MQVDVLLTPHTQGKGRALMQAVHQGALLAGISSVLTVSPRRAGAQIVLYGLGGQDRVRYAHRPDVISFDMGYWDRKGDDRAYRVSVGGFHCPKLIFKGPDPGPGRRGAMKVAEQVSRDGPIMLVGNGPKSAAVGARGWSAAKAREIRRLFPGRPLMYRPKPKRPIELGVTSDVISTEPIEQALEKVSLVVCRHSNVSVDACLAGVPVVCEDGAGASIYPSRLSDYLNQPSQERREEFTRRLAWWQWKASECASGAFWAWMRGHL